MALFTIPFEENANQTLTYFEAIACYEQMAKAYPQFFHLYTTGMTDSGRPLHVAILDFEGLFTPEKIRAAGKRILFINNGIHPGEPEGIDASVMLLRDYLTQPEHRELFKHLSIVVIPVYNIDGCLNRNAFSRVNQDGPESYGFRGNGRNYDLNRDFIKCDSRNARSFNKIFRHWDPDIFIDNHTSNGADYPYVMTLIPTLHSKLEAPLGQFLLTEMLPQLYGDMKERGWEMCPYVDTPGETPDSGIVNFCDYGRFSTGYAAMWNTIGFMPETHMLKPFADRLHSNYTFMDVVVRFVAQRHTDIAENRALALARTLEKDTFNLDYVMDASRYDSLLFKGYTAKYKPSDVSGLPRLWYDRNEPYEKTIPYYNYFNPTLTVEKPVAYIIPQAWEHVIERLKINGVEMHQLEEDVELEVEVYRIGDFQNREAWEGHYFHHHIEVEVLRQERKFTAGDRVVFLNQQANRYLIETLEPHAPDSWFAWNFFDAILMQKETYSDYVFEDLAAEFLRENPAIKENLEQLRQDNPDFAGNGPAQLDWVYRQSPWFEPSCRIYPVARLTEETDLPLK